MAIAAGRPGWNTPPGLDGSVAVARLLLGWRPAELARAQRLFPRLSRVELQDVYDAAVVAVRGGEYESELHLRNALRVAVRNRALNAIRNRHTREGVLEAAVPRFEAEREKESLQTNPENVVLERERRILAVEFVAGLSPLQRKVFELHAGHDMAWRAIATELKIDPNEARRVLEEVLSLRDRFLAIHAGGRQCGYRSDLIAALLSGREHRERVVAQAVVHLAHCRACQAAHKTTANQLRAMFEKTALGLIPLPATRQIHLSLLDRVWLILEKPIRLLDRLTPGGGPVRDRVIEAAAATGASVKVAGTLAGVIAVVATGVTVGIHAVLPTRRPAHHHHSPAVMSREAPTAEPPASILTASRPAVVSVAPKRRAVGVLTERQQAIARAFGPGRVVGPSHKLNAEGQHAPGGFAYLGVPHKTQSSTPTKTATAASSSTSTTSERTTSSSGGTEGQTRGGPFSP